MSKGNIDKLLAEADNFLDVGEGQQEHLSFDMHGMEQSRENLVE